VTTVNTVREKGSYALGVGVVGNLRQGGIDFDPDVFLLGIKDVLSGKKLLLTNEELQSAVAALQQEMQQKHETEQKALGEENKKNGDDFLAANKTKQGIITLPSGLQYKIVKQGTGPKPLPTDTVECHYRGTLIDGTEFDSSAKHGQAAIFPVGAVIAGWVEILQSMPVGSKYEVFVPADLAYGESSPTPAIGPHSTLVFDIELLSIK